MPHPLMQDEPFDTKGSPVRGAGSRRLTEGCYRWDIASYRYDAQREG